MQLEDTLQICLLALESRYPEHTIDFNLALPTAMTARKTGWQVHEIIAYLAMTSPEILQRMARLVINPQCSEIYLLERSEEQPAFIVHCRGKIPVHNIAKLQEPIV